MSELPPAVEARLKRLPKGLRDHIERARAVARTMALRHGLDSARVDLGIAAHDVARALDGDALLEQARRYGLRVHPVERRTPVLLHGPVAALWLQREDGIEDGEVLEAVRYHSTATDGMGSVAKVVFLADKLDPEKVKRCTYLERVAALAHENLERALLEYLDRELAHLLDRRQLVHPDSVEARNGLIATLRDHGE